MSEIDSDLKYCLFMFIYFLFVNDDNQSIGMLSEMYRIGMKKDCCTSITIHMKNILKI